MPINIYQKVKSVPPKKESTSNEHEFIIDDEDENEEVDEGYRGEYGDNFHYENENGYWTPNTEFNSDGLPIDEDGRIIDNDDDDNRFRDDFDYSSFYEPPVEEDLDQIASETISSNSQQTPQPSKQRPK